MTKPIDTEPLMIHSGMAYKLKQPPHTQVVCKWVNDGKVCFWFASGSHLFSAEEMTVEQVNAQFEYLHS